MKKLYQRYGMETSSRPFLIFKESSVKKESEDISVLIWTKFDSFAITYLT